MTIKLVGASPALAEIEQEIDCAARSAAKVLITGESGVGKDIVAQLIHQRSRRSGSFVTINCAGVPDSLLESELFGHMRGSFTGAYRDKRGWLDQAQNGTIFMDEVGEMSLRMQALLLRFLENGEIQRVGSDRVQSVGNVRVICATNRNLIERINEKSFREDLYYRLNVVHVVVPPLRSRREDIEPLIAHFLEVFGAAHHVKPPQLTAQALSTLAAYHWPGNVRELRNLIERLVIRHQSAIISPAELPREVLSAPAPRKLAEVPRRVDLLYERMVAAGDSFWSTVHDPFMSHDLTRDDLHRIVGRGLEHAGGNSKDLARFFNVLPSDQKRFLNFLRKYQCGLPFQNRRERPIAVYPSKATEFVERQRVAKSS